MLGRGLRLSPNTGKTNCLVLDLVGSTVQGMACTPTLFGIDPDLAIEDQSTDQLERLAKDRSATPPPSEADRQADLSAGEFAVEYRDYNIFDLVSSEGADGSLAVNNVRIHSRNAWVGVGGGKFVIELMGNYASVQPVKDKSESRAGISVSLD